MKGIVASRVDKDRCKKNTTSQNGHSLYSKDRGVKDDANVEIAGVLTLPHILAWPPGDAVEPSCLPSPLTLLFPVLH